VETKRALTERADLHPIPAGAIFRDAYEILAALGGGRSWSVYKARKLSTDQEVALKISRPAPDDVDTARLLTAMPAWSRLVHPNIVRLVDFGSADERTVFAAFQFVSGSTLRDVLLAEGTLSPRETAHLLGQVLDALGCAHARGIVHGNLGTQNVMVTKTGARRNAMVLDFGFAAEATDDLQAWGRMFLECTIGVQGLDDASALPAWLRDTALAPLLERVTATAHGAVPIDTLLEALAGIEPRLADARRPERGVLSEGERRQLSIVSCQLTVTASGDPVPAGELDEVFRAQQAACTALAERHGGRVAGTMGDRLLLVFGHPQAREDDARRAARAALAIADAVARAARDLETTRRLRLELRVGLHTGVTVVRDAADARLPGLDALVGLAPQIASGIATMASPGDVLVSGETHRLLRGAIAAEPAGRFVRDASIDLPVFRLRDTPSSPTGPAREETPLVGRTLHLGELREVWKRAERGLATAVFIRGEAGVGKSRLVRELRRAAGGALVLECRTVPESRDTPLRPFVDLLARAEESLETLLERYGFDLAQAMPLMTALLSRPPDPRFPAQGWTAERQKMLTLDTLLGLFLRIAESRPLLLVVEDLQWADPTTLELANLLVEEVQSAGAVERSPAAKLCVIFTARSEFEPPWSGGEVTLLQVPRLSPRETEEMVRAGPAVQDLPAAVLDEVIRRADGIPLFVEELTRMVVESPGGGATFDVPGTLRDLLTARLDSVSRGARETAQLAAVVGREFRYDVLHAVSTKEERELRGDLSELVAAGLILQRPSARTETYLVRHALICDAAYASLVRAKRTALHRSVADMLRTKFPDVEQTRPEILAHHCERGGDVEHALGYLQRVGSRALHQASYAEALAVLQKALALLATLPPSQSLRRREIELVSTLGTVHISMQGYAAPDVEVTFRRAWNLCTTLGPDIPLDVVYGLWGVYLTRSDPEGTAAVLPIFQQIARESNDPVALFTAHTCLGTRAYWAGDFARAHNHLELGCQLSRTDACLAYSEAHGYGIALYGHALCMSTLWFLGFPERANVVREELEKLAERARDPYATAVALGLIMSVAHESDPPDVEFALADRLTALAIEQHLPLWQAAGAIGRGGALLRRGDLDEAVGLIDGGLMGFYVCGVMCSYNYFLLYRIKASLRTGNVDEGLARIEEALGLCGKLVARLHEPELLRLKAELVRQRDGDAAAEPLLARALEIARRDGGKFHELQVATSLARLQSRQGRTADARALLAGVYEWFTEGFDAPYVREARELLAEI
jgi:class 3 adenylate cyclase/tetratricopeptide (TPR) repeat protein